MNSHAARIKRARSVSFNPEEDNVSFNEIQTFISKNIQLHQAPEPIVPYPNKGKKVTAEGFIRDIPTLPEKVLKRID